MIVKLALFIQKWIVDHYDLLAYVFFVCLAILIVSILNVVLHILKWRSESQWYELPTKEEKESPAK